VLLSLTRDPEDCPRPLRQFAADNWLEKSIINGKANDKAITPSTADPLMFAASGFDELLFRSTTLLS
jgi:hypothetical protein